MHGPILIFEDDGNSTSPYPDIPLDKKSCRLMGPTALIVQALMAVLVLLSLLYKRNRESPKRPWRIWLFDVSKQLFGQAFIHGVNVLISDVSSHVSAGNACTFYFLNILVDTTLGVGLIYVFLHVFAYVLNEKLHLTGFESGKYGDPPSYSFWLRQAAVYVVALSAMKLSVIGLFAVWPGISKVGDWLLSWTEIGSGETFQVIFVMGLFPILMNILQFWLIDSIVKASATNLTLPTSRRTSDERDREPLFRAHSDDDDDDDDHGYDHRHDLEAPPPVSASTSRVTSRDDLKTVVGSASDTKSIPSGPTTPRSISSRPSKTEVSAADAQHEYPPEGSVSSSSSSSRISHHSPASRHRYKQAPPPALDFECIAHTPAENVVTPATGDPAAAAKRLSAVVRMDVGRLSPGSAGAAGVLMAQEGSNGQAGRAAQDDVDDWANRVGEDEWTGRRMGARKEDVEEAWRSPAVKRVGS
ncbi:hypothetical protein CONPUDRAFT_168857 [Coniophora puteana RWD-64-598 SS2]|uniref:Vacuolar membrane protein n=1 Tax=Coniophora puteana (strain RWD-64-598) TaxID=741705 RepID=A0A5M3MBU3_CONPW|nr:uncharacterized protein CONPUDRAFT_168857 [Coniophora puteana RWD-64-598 SS2]EIW76290.1 hypothetical protein CONPUDRAFT_168857 [Coniophora puteana RWD-64-598 SS2]